MKMDLKKLGEISSLHEKLNSVGLTEEEEKLYCELNSEVTGFPKEFFSKDFNNKLNSIISDTENLLKKLEDNEDKENNNE